MRAQHIDAEPLHQFPYLNAAPRRAGARTLRARLPLHRGVATGLPKDVDAVLVTSDLQGISLHRDAAGQRILLGVELAELLAEMGDEGELPRSERVGVVLAGDLFSSPGGDVRGATGDVREVWLAFAERFAWVVGVRGNHDTFGRPKEQRCFEATPGVNLLDEGEIRTLGGIRFGGVGGIVGHKRKVARKTESEFDAALERLLEDDAEVVILHEGPPGNGRKQRGRQGVLDVLGTERRTVICGHAHWDTPLAEHGALQVLNVDARALLLHPE